MTKIMLVDDDPEIRRIYRSILEDEGFRVVEARSWHEATDMLILHSDVELMLLDIHMPDVNGDVVYDVARLYNPRMRVVVSSVYSLDEQKRMILKADDYFDKAQGTALLVHKVKRVLGLEEAPHGSYPAFEG